MWWMLLIALESGEYSAEIVVGSLAQCEQLKTTDLDLCMPVTVEFLREGVPSV